MFKKITATVLCLILLLCCGCSKSQSTDVKITGTDTKVIPKIENIIELQKSVFVAEINGVSKTDAVFTKYNIDISTYTLFDVTITESIDGITPTGKAKVYWLGTDTEFNTRLSIKKNDKYIFDCEVWVFGDEVVYLLSPYTDSYPKVDIANAVTIATSETEALAVCTLDEYKTEYKNAFDNVCERIEDFGSAKSTASRYYDIFSQMNEKNSNTEFYKNKDLNFEFVPSDEHIQQTAKKTAELFALSETLKNSDTVTLEQISQLFK